MVKWGVNNGLGSYNQRHDHLQKPGEAAAPTNHQALFPGFASAPLREGKDKEGESQGE
jgi:hypothetical protein